MFNRLSTHSRFDVIGVHDGVGQTLELAGRLDADRAESNLIQQLDKGGLGLAEAFIVRLDENERISVQAGRVDM